MSQRQRRARFKRRRWHAQAARGFSAAVATSAGLAIPAVTAQGAVAMTAAPDAMASTATAAPTQLLAVPAVTGVKHLVSTPVQFKGSVLFGTATAGGGKLWSVAPGADTPTVVKTITGKPEAPAEMTQVGDSLFFSADHELWKTNGAAAGTTLVDAHVDPTQMVNDRGTLFFAAGGNLWKSEGTAKRTTEVAQNLKISPDSGMVAVSGRVYFGDEHSGAAAYGSDTRLWSSNGTAAGTKPILTGPKATKNGNYYGLYAPYNLTAVSGSLFFTAVDVEDGNEENYDETVQITPKGHVAPIAAAGGGLTKLNGSLYFFDYDHPEFCSPALEGEGGCDFGTGFAVWKGAKPLVDVFPGANSYSYPAAAYLTSAGGNLFFAATNDSGPVELWKSNGTAAGTAELDDVAPKEMAAAGSTLVFIAKDQYAAGIGLWTSDGTAAGTTVKGQFETTGPLDSVAGSVFFTGSDSTSPNGYGLYRVGP